MSTLKYLCVAFVLLSFVPDADARRFWISRNHPIYLGPVSIEIRSGSRTLPTFTYRGNVYVLGARGAQYSIYMKNRTGQRLEAVVSVDGRDVITGTASRSYTRRGYVLNPYRFVNISGFRTSKQAVASFRFTTKSGSYASKMGGSWHRIGNLHVALFRERRRVAYIPRPMIPHRRHSHKRRYKTGGRLGRSKTAPSRGSRLDSAPRSRGFRRYRRYEPGLGTAYGQRKYAPVQYTSFKRATSFPSHRLTIRYNNCAGFRRWGVCSRWCPCYRRHWSRRPIIQRRQHQPRFSPPPPGHR
jgi:hypothetical protein